MLLRAVIREWLKNPNALFNIHKDIEKAINGNISFGQPAPVNDLIPTTTQTVPVHCENIDGVLVIVTNTGVANTEFEIVHNLGRIPTMFDLKRSNVALSVYDSGTAWTNTKIFVKCTAANAKITLHIH
jgi:hypothetical protein